MPGAQQKREADGGERQDVVSRDRGRNSGRSRLLSPLITTPAFHGPRLKEAKTGVLGAVLCALLTSRLVTAVVGTLPRPAQRHALPCDAEAIVDSAVPIAPAPARDHVRGLRHAPVTVRGVRRLRVCKQAKPVVGELPGGFGHVRCAGRRLPLADVHVPAQPAAEAAQAAGPK